MPIETIIIEVRLVPRLPQRAPHAQLLERPPIAAVAITATTSGAIRCHEAQLRLNPQHDQRSERHHLAVGEVGQPGRSEDD